MIIEIFILFTSLAFILAIVGKILDQELLIIFGFLVIGLMAIPLINQSLDYRTGSDITSEYNATSGITSSIINYNYDTYTDTVWFGLFFILISLSGMFMWYTGFGYGGRENEDDNND